MNPTINDLIRQEEESEMSKWTDGTGKIFTQEQKDYWVELGCYEGVFKELKNV